MDLQIAEEAIPADTKAVLLLCAAFSKEIDPNAKPLNLREYNALATALARKQQRPADLIAGGDEVLPVDEPGLADIDRMRALLSRGMQMAAAVERWQRLGLWVIGRGEDRYPERLRRNLRASAPPLLFGAGSQARLAMGGLAVVGSRDIDEEGLAFTRRVADRCAGTGIQVISGGARGVDQAAMQGSLEAGGGVVAVLADRLDRAATSREAKEPIRAGNLTLICPYEPEAGFTIGRAMGRNKVIYALSDHALVVHFTRGQGGSWGGAVEQLGRNGPDSASVPVFVRVAHNSEDGLRELRSKGALTFPEQDFWSEDAALVLNRAVPPSTTLWPEQTTESVRRVAKTDAASVPDAAPARRGT